MTAKTDQTGCAVAFFGTIAVLLLIFLVFLLGAFVPWLTDKLLIWF